MEDQNVGGIFNRASYTKNIFNIKKTVDILPSDLNELLSFIADDTIITAPIFSMSPFDLNKKNQLNGIDSAYNQCIEDDYSSFQDIEDSLINDSTGELKAKYKIATDILNRQYAATFSGKMGDFITAVLVEFKKEKNPSDLEITKLGKLLNYMYANCHIGIKP